MAVIFCSFLKLLKSSLTMSHNDSFLRLLSLIFEQLPESPGAFKDLERLKRL